MMKNRIYVIFTGGTIGSAVKDGGVNLETGSKKLLLELYRAERGDDIEFVPLSPVDMLSENVRYENLKKIADCIRGLNLQSCDGIIVTHGTDTLCFTANYFSCIFADIPVPLVFVSSLYPLPELGQKPHESCNGLDNFIGAADFIKQGVKGVFVSFRNAGEVLKIHLGSRITFSDQINGHYHSALGEHFAEIDGGISYPETPHNPSPSLLKAAHNAPVEEGLCDEVMLVTARSLLNFEMYDFSKARPKAVIIELYHSGTVCTVGESLNFINFAKYCEKQGVPVVISPVDSGANVYGSMSALPDNLFIAYDMTVEMTIVKVMSALAHGKKPDAYFERNIFFEKLNRA